MARLKSQGRMIPEHVWRRQMRAAERAEAAALAAAEAQERLDRKRAAAAFAKAAKAAKGRHKGPAGIGAPWTKHNGSPPRPVNRDALKILFK